MMKLISDSMDFTVTAAADNDKDEVNNDSFAGSALLMTMIAVMF